MKLDSFDFGWRRTFVLFATLTALALAIPGWQYFDRWWSGVPIRYIARRGEPRTMTLNDGTRVVLDADTELVVKIGALARRAALARGEAFFSVVHEPSRPFEVEVGRARVTALGTRFDVERLSGSVRVTVFEGRIGLTTSHGEMVLTAGQSSGYETGGLLPVTATDSSEPFWQDGQRRFDAEPLSDVVERFARHHAVTFTFADPRLQRLRVSGTFRTEDLDQFLQTLSAAFPVEVRWLDPQHVEFVSRGAPRGRVGEDRLH